MRQKRPYEVRYPAVVITDRLESKFQRYLRTDIVSVRIVQSRSTVWLEIIRETEIDGRFDCRVTWRDLGIILRDGVKFFDPNDSLFINADKFANQLDAMSMIMTTDLFDDESYEEINEQFNQDRQSA